MILVTGGAGYIGSFTTKRLLDYGYEVLVVDSLENGHVEAVDKRAVFEKLDLANTEALKEIFKKYKIEAVIDFAAYLAVGESQEIPEKYFKNNVFNFINLLDVMKDNGCFNIIKSSTASTYGEPEDKFFPLKEDYQETIKPIKSGLLSGKWNEKQVADEGFFKQVINYYEKNIAGLELSLSPLEVAKLRIPASIYGLTKLMDEIIMEKYERLYGLKGVALRYFNVCGASEDGKMGDAKPVPTNLMTLVILSVLDQTKKLKVYGNDYPTKDGTGVRDYIHPIDLAEGHVKALEYLLKTKQSNVFNLGRGEGYSVMEVIKEVERASGRQVNFEIAPRRSGDPAISLADPSKANKVLNWTAKFNLAQMAKTAWLWHSKFPDGYGD